MKFHNSISIEDRLIPVTELLFQMARIWGSLAIMESEDEVSERQVNIQAVAIDFVTVISVRVLCQSTFLQDVPLQISQPTANESEGILPLIS